MDVEVLEVVAGASSGTRFALAGPETIVGRSVDCDVVLEDPRVSRRHARLVLTADRLTLEDLRSTGGTRVNDGAPVQGAVALARGDRVRVGQTELLVLWVPEAATEMGEAPPAATLAGDVPEQAAAPPPPPAPTPPPPAAVPPPPAPAPPPEPVGPPPVVMPPPAVMPAPPPVAEPVPAAAQPAAPPPPAYAPPAPASAPAGPAPGGPPMGLWLAAALVGIVGGGLGIASAFLDFSAGNSLWGSGEGDIRAQALILPGIATALALGLLVAVLTRAGVRLRDAEASMLTLFGAAVAGLSINGLFAEFSRLGVGLYLVLVAGILAAAGGLIGMVAAGIERGAPGRSFMRLVPAAGGAIVGGAMAAAAAPLDLVTVSFVGETFDGFSSELPFGRAFLALGAATALAGALVLVLSLATDRPGAALGAALGLGGGLLGVGIGAITLLSFGGSSLEIGPWLVLAGSVIAAAGLITGALLLATRPAGGAPPAPHT